MTAPSAEFLAFQAALAGEYSLARELGRGGMGVVYLARDVQLDRDVAIKVLPGPLALDATARERFLREARTAAGLSHPHIVPIHRVGDVGGFVFFVMSYVKGETLGERLRTRGPLPPVDAMRIMREVAWALAYAHGRGVIHKDVKPDNILLEAETGRAIVSDFGIAQGESDVRDEGRVMGTAQFMSPEQAAGEFLDGRSDLYSLGVMAHLAVSGRLPADTTRLAAPTHPGSRLPSVLEAAPGLPPALASAIDRCLALDPALRFTDGEALATALAPAPARPELPPGLRAWLAARNPLLVPYMAWMGLFGTLTTVNLVIWLAGQRPAGFGDLPLLASIASLPVIPIVGYHLNQGYKQFRAGFSLADLRAAMDVARREREDVEATEQKAPEPGFHRPLRSATVAAAAWLGATFVLLLLGVIHENRGQAYLVLAPVLATMGLGAASNALDVQFIPNRVRRWWQAGVRDRLWNSRVGQWFARRFGAPEHSRAVDEGAFRATEVALGVAAADLFAALPAAYRTQLDELPAIVRSLEARAADARAELGVLAAMAPAGDGVDVLAARRAAAKQHLSDSVAALEGIRLDLLRIHAGSSDLAPLTTLMGDARRIGDDLHRLAAAQRELDDALHQTT
ncbi:MAG: serine/threonine protein kinase [Gemmatimonadetes bacterium]|nr:serine/threonine protein kinase [Gemmatimonadota bacterium]